MKKKIGIIGMWHLGCVLSAVWSKLGNRVYGFDYDSDRINNLSDGKPPIFEPFLSETIKESFNRDLITFSNNIKSLSECDFIFLSYDTPVRNDDSSDTAILEKSVSDIRNVMKDGAVLIISSQSPVGFCSILREKIQEKNNTVELAYSPENLRLGEAINCYLNPDRIILGISNDNAEKKCIELFSQISDNILSMSLESAEMVKHGINSFLATSITFANNLSDICEEKNANIDDVIKGIKSDLRIGKRAYLSPGIGFSGGTLGRDLQVLDKINRDNIEYAKLFGIIHKLNNERKFSIIDKLEKTLGVLDCKNIGILGLTYKPGTSTLRRSLPLEIVELLINKKLCVSVYDPKADYSELSYHPKFEIKKSIKDISKGVDILVLLTEWPEFKDFRWGNILINMKNPYFFDTKNFLNGSEMKREGFKYYSIGRNL